MSDLENSGYKGLALELLKNADCSVGDILKVTSKGKSYEGILIPRFGEGTAIIIKMKSGYNIGIEATIDVKIEKIRQRHQTHLRCTTATQTEPRASTRRYHEYGWNHRKPS